MHLRKPKENHSLKNSLVDYSEVENNGRSTYSGRSQYITQHNPIYQNCSVEAGIGQG